jgi:hypothetical protein
MAKRTSRRLPAMAEPLPSSGHENAPEGAVRVSDYGPGTRF